MIRPVSLAALPGLCLVALLGATGCGGDDTKCGAGTHREGGSCLPDATCGAGTLLVDGSCLPDGSVVCVQGTRFDAGTGTCLVDETACADGTTLVGSVCTPDDELLRGAANLVEAAEPNGPGDAAPAGAFTAPAEGTATTFYGCITPSGDAGGNLAADTDTWKVTASGPMVLEITTDGLRGLSAGFEVTAADAALTPALDGWRRLGLNRTGDTSRRQVYLPAAGIYALDVIDARTAFGEAAAGAADTCYFATVKRVATPAATAATLPTTTGQDAGQVRLLSFTATAEGDLLDVVQRSTNPAFVPAFVVMKEGALRATSYVPSPSTGAEAARTVGALVAGEVLTVVLDAEYDYAVAPIDYTVDLTRLQAQPLPTAGGTVTVTEKNTPAGPSLVTVDYLYFDVNAAGVVHFNLTASKPLNMYVLRKDVVDAGGELDAVASISPFGTGGIGTFQGEFVRFLAPGRYYFTSSNPAVATAGGTYTVTATLTDMPISPLALGAEVVAQPIISGSAFHGLDLTDPVWLEFGVTGTTNWGASGVSIEAYDLSKEGWLRSGAGAAAGMVFPAFSGAQPAVAPLAPMGRILLHETRDFLLRVKPTAATGTGPTYSLLVQNRTGVTDLGQVAPGTAASATITALPGGASARFIARAPPGGTLTATAHPVDTGVDLRLLQLDAAEGVLATVDVGRNGADETFTVPVRAAPVDWIAWTVENRNASRATDVSLAVTTTAPRLYTITSGALPWADACSGGTTLGSNLDDSVLTGQVLPAGFTAFHLFGDALPATFRVSPNGWLSWDTGAVNFGAWANQPIPAAAAPNGVIAPFWQDLEQVTLCRKDDATAETVTFQWTGRIWQRPGQDVQFQAVLHAGGALDFIYGPQQVNDGAYFFDGTVIEDDGNGATAGVENLLGSFGQQVFFDTAGALPNTSYTLTPQ